MRKAKKALFGETQKLARPEQDDQSALLNMAYEYVRDRQPPRDKTKIVRSIRKLALLAASATFGNSSKAIVERLRKKFVEQKFDLLYFAREHDYVAETIQLQQLKELQRLLREYIGIKMDLTHIERRSATPNTTKRTARIIRNMATT